MNKKSGGVLEIDTVGSSPWSIVVVKKVMLFEIFNSDAPGCGNLPSVDMVLFPNIEFD